ncbi:hypothetical protein [uncultured Ruthenibacterium sp.]
MYPKETNDFVESTPVRDCNPNFTSQENYDLSDWNDVLYADESAKSQER